MVEQSGDGPDVVALGRIPFEAAWQAEPSPEDQAIVAKALNDVDMRKGYNRDYYYGRFYYGHYYGSDAGKGGQTAPAGRKAAGSRRG